MGLKRNAYRISMGKPEGMRSIESSRRRWEDNIKMDWRNRMRRYGLDSSG
jgi:hypothetical protein